MKHTMYIWASALATLALSCANQAAPGGGPVDAEPPRVSASEPSNGQVNVSARARVSVVFSEWVNPAGAPGAVSVYPPLPEGVTVRASKNRVTVAPNGLFKSNTTYHVVINTSLQDLRGNAIPRPVSIVFSTGAVLDSGALDGAVVSLGPLAALPKVALYYVESGEGGDAGYFAAPDYAAQCDSAGAFSFSNLREGNYRALAFSDPNRTGRLRPGDMCFAPLEEVIAVTKAARAIRLYPSDSDTATAPKRASEKAAPDTAVLRMKSYSPSGLSSLMPEVRVVWSRPARVSLSMAMASDTSGSDSVAFFFAAAGGYSDTTLLAPSRRLKPGSVYRLRIPVTSVRDERGNNAVVDGKKGRAGRGGKGKEGAAGNIISGGILKKSAAADDTTGDSIVKDVSLSDSIVKDSLKSRAATEPEISAVEITIKTVAADSICYRLHGGADCLEPDGRRKWVYRPIKGGETFTSADSSGTFSFDSIPASKGTLYWFIDDNGDNALTPGKLVPWRAPERFFAAPDTVEARARWEVENVRVEGCE